MMMVLTRTGYGTQKLDRKLYISVCPHHFPVFSMELIGRVSPLMRIDYLRFLLRANVDFIG